MEFKIKRHDMFDYFILGADIGGKNTNLAVAGVKKEKYRLLFSIDYKTESLPSLEVALRHCLDFSRKEYGIIVSKACLGIAGPVEKGVYCKPTFIEWDVSLENILKNNYLQNAKLINDFVALGYSINVLTKKDLKKLNNVESEPGAVKAVLGAGTGLGETTLYYDKGKSHYIPLPSEGGHVDIPIKNLEELEFFNRVQRKAGKKFTLAHILSGQGIEYMYNAIKEWSAPSEFDELIESSDDKPSLISKFRKKDPACKETFEMFTKLYGRTAKNFSLSTLCYGGLYIGGGIAIKNNDIFQSEIFWKEFFSSPTCKENVLEKIPVYLITSYDTGVRGALFAAMKL